MANIKHNIENIQKIINRYNKEIKIIGVTKSVDVGGIIEAMEAGLTDFGESKIQEAIPKIEALKGKYKDIRWHFIGHLQSNKVNKAIKYFNVVQSIDNIELVKKMSETLAGENMFMEAFVEIKISQEPAKFGVVPDEVFKIVSEISGLKNIYLNGLMTIAPNSDDAENARTYFKKVKSLFDEIKKNYKRDNIKMQYLSMGMTSDYIVALEEGANMVRIGTGIFGNRVI